MDNDEAHEWLAGAWDRVLETGIGEPDSEVDRLVNSSLVSIRYVTLTQMLGKSPTQTAKHTREESNPFLPAC